MQTLRILLLIAVLAVATSRGFILKKPGSVTVGEKFVQDIKTVTNDLKQSAALKKQAAVGVVSAIGNAKLGVFNHIKDAKVHIVQSIVEAEMAKVQAIRAAKYAFFKSLANKFASSKVKVEHQEPSIKFFTTLIPFHHSTFSGFIQVPLNNALKLPEAFTKQPNTMETEPTQKDHIKIGDTEYIFIPTRLHPIANNQERRESVSEEPVFLTSTEYPPTTPPPGHTLTACNEKKKH